MLMIQEPCGNHFDAVQSVWSVYEDSFPSHERRSLTDYQYLCANDTRFVPALLVEHGHTLGLLWYWKFSEFTYLEHFALNKAMRNHGKGGAFLDLFLTQHSRLILEVEPPKTTLTIRRVDFYHRHGLILKPIIYTNPGYGRIDTPHELQLMVHSSWSENQCHQFLDILFRDVLKKPKASNACCVP